MPAWSSLGLPSAPDTLRGRRWSFACLYRRDRPGARRARTPSGPTRAGRWRRD